MFRRNLRSFGFVSKSTGFIGLLVGSYSDSAKTWTYDACVLRLTDGKFLEHAKKSAPMDSGNLKEDMVGLKTPNTGTMTASSISGSSTPAVLSQTRTRTRYRRQKKEAINFAEPGCDILPINAGIFRLHPLFPSLVLRG